MRQGRHAPPYFEIIDPNDPEPAELIELVELVRALARRPRILHLDEPASGLDAAESQAFGELLAGLVVQWEIGVLLVEHDMTLALSVCDWIHVLDFGRSLIDAPRPSSPPVPKSGRPIWGR